MDWTKHLSKNEIIDPPPRVKKAGKSNRVRRKNVH